MDPLPLNQVKPATGPIKGASAPVEKATPSPAAGPHGKKATGPLSRDKNPAIAGTGAKTSLKLGGGGALGPVAGGVGVVNGVAKIAKAEAPGLLDTVIDSTVGRSKLDSHAEATTNHGTEDAAKAALDKQKDALLDVNKWGDNLSGAENADFKLYDKDGKPTDRTKAEVGDFVAIDLPGPTGTDWVRVESASADADGASVTVRPSHDPTAKPVNKSVTAHFFTNEATNTFSVQRNGTSTTAAVTGRNETANTGSQSSGILAAGMNYAVSQGAWGAQFHVPGTNTSVNGLQQHQWNRFTGNLAAVK